MATDNDLSALLPEPPPPRPARREAAITEALRRFDGHGESVPTRPVSNRPARVFEGWGRTQIATLASAALILLVSVPIWWAERDRLVPPVQQASPPVSQDQSIAAPEAELQVPQQTAAASAAPPPAARAAPPSLAASAAPAAIPRETVSPPPAPAPAPPADARPLPEARDAVAASQLNRLPQAPTAARQSAPAAESDRTIVVTGSRIARPDFAANSPIVTVDESVLSAPPGDWNACTVLDPRQDLSVCRAFADPAARGASGRAAAQLADGLTLAWQGELDRAIDAFDRAIRAEPDLSIAYLNRGLAYQAKGDLRRSLADLNRAVARDPNGARGYYHRSVIHRARGDTARAEADARRAIEIDPAYEALLQ